LATIRAVMFDMDGVLIDSEPAHLAAMDEILRREHVPVPDADDWQRVFFGRPDRDGLRDWFALHGLNDYGAIARIMAEKLTLFSTHFERLVAPFPDAQQLARDLHARGVPLALVTGARRAEMQLALARFELDELFAACVSGDDVTVGKPDPEPYLRGAAALGCDSRDCLVIEDAEAGVAAALAAGASVLAIDRIGQPERFGDVPCVSGIDAGVLDGILARME
jgi:HAD superfamily hydrolase (TIGR01509 family)